jgi:hypothetical protein
VQQLKINLMANHLFCNGTGAHRYLGIKNVDSANPKPYLRENPDKAYETILVKQGTLYLIKVGSYYLVADSNSQDSITLTDNSSKATAWIKGQHKNDELYFEVSDKNPKYKYLRGNTDNGNLDLRQNIDAKPGEYWAEVTL